jgi:hypothetical protein
MQARASSRVQKAPRLNLRVLRYLRLRYCAADS